MEVLKVLASLAVASCLVVLMAHADESKFTSDLASVVDNALASGGAYWDYSDGPNGPAHWGDLSKDYIQCRLGKQQSPAAVTNESVILDRFVDSPAFVYYKPARAYIQGDGKTLEVIWSGGIFNVHDYDYALEKLLFHAPSEHTYFGERFDIEIQLYHTHPEAGIAISSVMFKEGEANPWLEQITSSLPDESSLEISIGLGLLDSFGIELEALDWSRYYRYSGSITTPPCTENDTIWSLLKIPVTASKEQIAKIKAALHNAPNVRPAQPLNDRGFHYPRFVDA